MLPFSSGQGEKIGFPRFSGHLVAANFQERALETIGLTCGRLSSSETFDRRKATHNAATASIYGRMTLETRLILANFHNSSAVDILARCDSNSASSATSNPTLLRNLKQSATVKRLASSRATAVGALFPRLTIIVIVNLC